MAAMTSFNHHVKLLKKQHDYGYI